MSLHPLKTRPLSFEAKLQQYLHYDFVKPYINYIIAAFLVIALIVVIIKSQSMSFKQGRNKHKRPKRSFNNELGSGDLATKKDLFRWLKRSKALDTVLAIRDLKGDKGILVKEGGIYLPIHERNRHVLVIAKTGSGKTSRLILPVLYHDCLCPIRSTVVLDSKPEMWEKLAAMTRKFNPKKTILLFNPLDKARSLSWNILSKIQDDSDAKLITNTIIMATDNPNSKSDSPFFRNNAYQLLNSVAVGLLHDSNDRLSMPRIHELVQAGMTSLCDWLEAHPHALKTSRTFVELARSGSQNADTIMSELSMRLAAWDLSVIRATTFYDELDLERLVLEPTLLVIELRESELEMLRPMANVIIVEIMRMLTKYAENCPGQTLPRPVGLIIDEFASALGRLPDIHVKLNTLRSRNVSIIAAIQSIAQIKANYDKDADSVIAGFSTKIFMPAVEVQDAEWASKESGIMTIRFETASKGHSKKLTETFASKNANVQEQVQQRPVLTPGEIGRPLDNAATFFMPDTPVFQGHLVPFYEIPEMRKRLSMSEDIRLRESPIVLDEQLPQAIIRQPEPSASPALESDPTLTAEQVCEALEQVKQHLDWENTTGLAREWWKAFEDGNRENLLLVLKLAQELWNRNATISEFFLAYVYSNSENIQENLNFLDKMKEEQKNGQGVLVANNEVGAQA